MKPFLKSIAEAYVAKAGEDLGDYCFLFPNKRSGTFFLKYLRESLPDGMTVVAPVTTNITDFVGFLSGRLIDNNVDILFTLYDVYVRLLRGGTIAPAPDAPPHEEVPPFDSFLHWGSAVVSDIDEVDRYCVDLSIFRNVRDYREISSDFLTDEQRRVMQEYFGYYPDPTEGRSIWKSTSGEINRKFLYLWQMLLPLYEGLKGELDARGLATSGGAYRLASERIAVMTSRDFPYRRIVAVGFNALSTSEFRIFKALQGMTTSDGEPFADFFWDASGPVLRAEIPNSASKFIDFNIREFPAPDWALPTLHESDAEGMPPEIVEIASPSDTMQAKIAGEILDDLASGIGADEVQSTRTAVVLPDENLLFPMLYSLGGDVSVNLTVGYPLSATSVMTFISLARRLMLKSRRSGNDVRFLADDLRPFVAHPFVQVGIGTRAVAAVFEMLDTEHLFEISSSRLDTFSPWLGSMRRYLEAPRNDAFTAVAAIDEILKMVKEAILKSGGNHALVGKEKWLDMAHIDIYREALCRLRDAISGHEVSLSLQTALYLADRLLGGERVEFEGEPLVGLQIMGLLETRSLDFENLIIPSLNEGNFPRRQRTRTFIPDSMRRAYAMPPANYEESLFAYYFYRLISRARRVWLLYDSRAASGRTKGASRYLYQLRYLYARRELRRREYAFSIVAREQGAGIIRKTPEVMRKLDRFLGNGPYRSEIPAPDARYLSPSSIKTFGECGTRFYLQTVEQLFESRADGDDIGPVSQGNVIHNAMERLYPGASPGHPLTVTPEYIRGLLEPGDTRILDAVRRAFNTRHYRLPEEEADRPLPGGVELVADKLTHDIAGILRYDLSLAPFLVLGTELKLHTDFRLSDRHPFVNVKGSFDRLDLVTIGGRQVLRIVDYKTGSSLHNRFRTVDDLFDPEADTSYAFQLAFYAMILKNAGSGLQLAAEQINLSKIPYMEFYNVPEMRGEGYVPAHIQRPESDAPRAKYRDVTDYSEIEEEYEEGLRHLMARIFDPEEPFMPPSDPATCGECYLRDICGR